MRYRLLLPYGSNNRCELQVWQPMPGAFRGGYWRHVGWFSTQEAAMAECDRLGAEKVEVY
jgi:hypothetical protein